MKLQCGVVGVGHLGQYHAEKFARIDSCDLAGVCDLNRSRAESVAQKFSTTAYTDFREMLRACDAISIAADTTQHFAIAKCAIHEKVHVLVEKPITHTVEEAEQLVAMAQAKDVLLQVGHLERFNPAIIKLNELVSKPLFINCQRISTFVQRDGLIGSDVIIDLMIHDIDLICYLMKESKPVRIDAVGGQLFTNEIDICDARLNFSDGRTATLTTSRIGRRPNRMIKLFEFGACYVADLQTKTLQHIARNADLSNDYQLKTTEAFCDNSKDSLLLEIEAFVDSIIHGKPPQVSGKDGLRAITLATSIRDSVWTTERMWHVNSSKHS